MPQYVRVKQLDGRYWFVRENERFLSLGVNVVEPLDQSKTPDGRVYNVLPRFNQDKAAWAGDAVARLKRWNFTTVAAWSDETLYQNVPMYHTRVIWFGDWGRNDARLIDVFSPAYAAAVDRTGQKEVAPHATNEYLIGFFANNELPWYGERGWPTSPEVSLLSRYFELPARAPGKARLVEFFQAHYSNSFDAVLTEWKVSATNFEGLLMARNIKPRIPSSKRAVISWAGLVAERYYELCATTLRKYAPNHLFLGSRFAERAYEPIMAACGKYADVVSLNHYRRTGRPDLEQIGAISALCGKPILITEFSFRAVENSSDCANSKGADVTVQTQADRAQAYRSYAAAVLAEPYILGFDWFMYHDQPPAGRFDGENSNYGLLDIYDRPYTELLDAITEINGRARQIHAQSTRPEAAYESRILADYREVTLRGADQPLAQPVLFADVRSTYDVWGDYANGASLKAIPTPHNTLLLEVTPGPGWGCGITFRPNPGWATNEDGSVSLLGGTTVVVRIKSTTGCRLGVGVNESGAAPLESQTFAGWGHADGESYQQAEQSLKPNAEELKTNLIAMESSSQHGNQRGNKCIDMDAIQSIHLYFPGGQPSFLAELSGLSVE